MRQAMRVAIWLMTATTIPAWAQTDKPDVQPPDNRQPDGEAQRRERRDRWERMRNASPEERDRMFADGQVRMLTRTYELNDVQQKRVRDEVTRMNREYRESLGDDATRLDQFREEMGRQWRQRAGGDASGPPPNPSEDPKYRDLMDRMQEIQQRHPLDWDGRMKRIEALLPEEQAAAGRARRDQWNQAGNGPPWGGPGGWGRMGRGNPDPNGRDNGRFRRRDGQNNGAPRFGGAGSGLGVVPSDAGKEQPKSAGAADVAQTDRVVPSAPPAEPQPLVITVPLHPWDIYTEEFIRSHKLDKNQAAAARAVVKGLKEREAPIRKAQQSDRAAAARLLDPHAKEKRIKQLDAPIDALFKELQQRLDALLTSAQRHGASAK